MEKRNDGEYDTLPLARSTKVSSERMIVTSALGSALPLNTVPVFFKSMVHVTVSLALLVTWSSKIPLAWWEGKVCLDLKRCKKRTCLFYLRLPLWLWEFWERIMQTWNELRGLTRGLFNKGFDKNWGRLTLNPGALRSLFMVWAGSGPELRNPAWPRSTTWSI